MDYRPAKAANVAFGALCTGLAWYNVKNAVYYQGMDQIFIAVAAICTIEAFISLMKVACTDKMSVVFDQVLRGIICIVLIGSGIRLLISAVDVEKKNCTHCQFNPGNQSLWPYSHCQHYEVKLAAGILAIVNGLIYAITKKIAPPRIIHTQPPEIMPIDTPVTSFVMVHPVQEQKIP